MSIPANTKWKIEEGGSNGLVIIGDGPLQIELEIRGNFFTRVQKFNCAKDIAQMLNTRCKHDHRNAS